MDDLEKEHLDRAVRELQESLGCVGERQATCHVVVIGNYYAGTVTIQHQDVEVEAA